MRIATGTIAHVSGAGYQVDTLKWCLVMINPEVWLLAFLLEMKSFHFWLLIMEQIR